MKELGIYIHIPFCKSKCYYCDFTSYSNKNVLIDSYIKAIKEEINKEEINAIIKTIYIGGGTPSYINEKYIEEILNILKYKFKIVENAEITIELNPGTANIEKIKKYYDIGINRVSVGLQSSKDILLKEIGRIHTFKDYLTTIKLLKQVGFNNINTDIIIGLPNQTIYDVEDTLKEIIKLNLNHISIYSLIIEQDTKLEKLINEGKLKLPDDEIERYMYWFAKRKLEENGYIHYEISNFSKPQYKSKHNLDCWNQKEYIGFGVSASSYINNIRYTNIGCIEEYISNINGGNILDNRIIEEKQDKISKMKEYMILGLRKIDGIDITEFRRKFELSPLYIFNKELTKLVKENLIVIDINNIKLSKKGLDLANIVWEEFI